MRKTTKVVGSISREIAKEYSLYEYEGREMHQSLNLYLHIKKHINEFISFDSYNKSITNIDKIISDPYFVYYDTNRNSLLSYKKIDEFTCVVVKLNIKNNKNIYVSTMYPVNEAKIERQKSKALIEKYAYHGIF